MQCICTYNEGMENSIEVTGELNTVTREMFLTFMATALAHDAKNNQKKDQTRWEIDLHPLLLRNIGYGGNHAKHRCSRVCVIGQAVSYKHLVAHKKIPMAASPKVGGHGSSGTMTLARTSLRP